MNQEDFFLITLIYVFDSTKQYVLNLRCSITDLEKWKNHQQKIYDASDKKKLVIQQKSALGTLIVLVIHHSQWHPPAHHRLQHTTITSKQLSRRK